MPLYEYHCPNCDEVFEALRPLQESSRPWPCPNCGTESERVISTSFSAMSRRDGYPQRVPYHQRPVRNVEPKPRPATPPKARPEGKGSSKKEKRKA